MAEQLTDAQLSEAVCKALGIEPRVDYEYDDYGKCVHKEEVYPNVLDWAGFGRVVERMRMLGIRWDHIAMLSNWNVAIYDARTQQLTKFSYADTLPRAMALAVRAWKEGR